MARPVNVRLPDRLLARIDALTILEGTLGGQRSTVIRRLLLRGLEVEQKRREDR